MPAHEYLKYREKEAKEEKLRASREERLSFQRKTEV